MREPIAVLVAVNEGVLDDLPVDAVAEAERRIRRAVTKKLPEICRDIEEGEKVTGEMVESIRQAADEALKDLKSEAED